MPACCRPAALQPAPTPIAIISATVPCSSTPALTRSVDVVAAAVFDHHRVDAVQMQQVREQQPGWAGADDANLRS